MIFRDADVQAMLRDLGQTATINGVPGVYVLVDETFTEVADGVATGAIGQRILVTARRSEQGQIGQTIILGSTPLTIRDLIEKADGALIGALCERA